MGLLSLVTARMAGWGMAVLGALLAFLTVYQRGRQSAKAEVDRATAGATARMLDAAVQAPVEKADVAKDLRAGRF